MTAPNNRPGDHRGFVEVHEANGPRSPRGRRRIPPVSVLPTLFTLGNLVAGFAAIHYAAKPPDFIGPWGWTGLTLAGALIFFGMVLDAVDGWVARLTRSISDLGGQLDSLADVVTFGVAPAYMMLLLVGRQVANDSPTIIIGPEADDALGKVVWAVAVLFVCCAALRLARFNIETGPSGLETGNSFRGLPSPGAAGAVAGLILLHQHLVMGTGWAGEVPSSFARGAALGIPLITLLCGLAMVSSIPYAHVTKRYLYGARSFAYVARLVVLLALAIWFPPEMLALTFSAYAIAGPVGMLKRRSVRSGQRPGDEDDRQTPAQDSRQVVGRS